MTWDGAERRQARPVQRLLDERHWAKVRDWLLVTVALFAITAFMMTAWFTIQTNRTVAEINRRQLEAVKLQNEAQLCAQHDIIVNFRRGFARLGLPVENIQPPNVEGFSCDTG